MSSVSYGLASARRGRALRGRLTRQFRSFVYFPFAFALLSCESVNYAPSPVAAQMAKHGGQHDDLATLREGRALFVSRCIECHALPALWRYNTEDWPDIVNSMSHRASLKPAEREAIVAYILTVRFTEH